MLVLRDVNRDNITMLLFVVSVADIHVMSNKTFEN